MATKLELWPRTMRTGCVPHNFMCLSLKTREPPKCGLFLWFAQQTKQIPSRLSSKKTFPGTQCLVAIPRHRHSGGGPVQTDPKSLHVLAECQEGPSRSQLSAWSLFAHAQSRHPRGCLYAWLRLFRTCHLCVCVKVGNCVV